MRPSIIYIMGVAGSGKTTIGKRLSAKIDMPFFDADDLHSIANKEKMKAGIPLTDEDRADWLININAVAKQQMEAGAVIACSALKEKYRKVLSSGITTPVFWIFLNGNYDLIKRRMEERTGHYMPPGLLTSQFEALEVPEQCLTIDVSMDPEQIVERLIPEIDHG